MPFSISQSKGHVPTAQIAATSDEYVLDQLSTSEEKLLKLLEELDGKDLNELLKQMEEEEVIRQSLSITHCIAYFKKNIFSVYFA